MKVLVLQHVEVEHPGVFRDFFFRDGIDFDTIELDAGQPIPPLEPYDLMLVMGGPQEVWQEAEHPWLIAEKAAIRRFTMDMNRPYLGICFGHQLLAAAIGGGVRPAHHAEVGVMEIRTTAAGHADPLLRGLPDPLTVLQWHSTEVYLLPPNAEVLAFSPACGIQAFRYGRHAYGLQCHVEITSSTVPEWSAIPEYAAALEKLMGKNAVGALEQAVNARSPEFHDNAAQLYRNLISLLRATNAENMKKAVNA